MTNVVTPFRSGLFGSRGCDIKAALDYVDELALASSDAVAVHTAARVLLNTIEAAVAQSQGPSPEKLAIIALIDERVMENQRNIKVMIGEYLQDHIDDFISNWMSNSFDFTDYGLVDMMNEWMENNLSDKLEDIDLVVRIR